MSDTKPIQMSAEEAALHKEYRRLLMVREDEREWCEDCGGSCGHRCIPSFDAPAGQRGD